MVCGGRAELERSFGALAALQPVAWSGEGLVCAPCAAGELAGPALAACPFPWRPHPPPMRWPRPPAAMVGAWYRRGSAHVPAPSGVRELVQADGEGFGPHDHPTTALCLSALERLSWRGPLLDAGCGSGLLSQAWAKLRRGPVIAVDLDGRALDQARRSACESGLTGRIDFRRLALGRLEEGALRRRAIVANLPLGAQLELVGVLRVPPPVAILSGMRLPQAQALVVAYRRLGLRLSACAQRAGFVCLTLTATHPLREHRLE